jgi:hypothetical protein
VPKSALCPPLSPERLKDCRFCGRSFYPPDHQLKAQKYHCRDCTRAGRHHNRSQPALDFKATAQKRVKPPCQKALIDNRLEFMLDLHRYITLGSLLQAERLTRTAYQRMLISHEERQVAWAMIDEADHD